MKTSRRLQALLALTLSMAGTGLSAALALKQEQPNCLPACCPSLACRCGDCV